MRSERLFVLHRRHRIVHFSSVPLMNRRAFRLIAVGSLYCVINNSQGPLLVMTGSPHGGSPLACCDTS
jgi:hypothetical protein